jgi:hypothetical protein
MLRVQERHNPSKERDKVKPRFLLFATPEKKIPLDISLYHLAQHPDLTIDIEKIPQSYILFATSDQPNAIEEETVYNLHYCLKNKNNYQNK